MKIKKTFQGELPDNRVVNAKSNSATDAYSANYLNDKLRNVVVSPTEPTTGEDVWIKRSSNILKFDNFEKTVNGVTFTMKDQVLHVEGTATAYTQECYLPINLTLEEAMTLTVDWSDDNLVPKAAYTYNGTSYYPNLYSQELEPGTYLNQLYFIIASGATVNTDVRFQLEKGRGFSGWQPVMEKAILVKNDNDVYEDLIKKSVHIGVDKPKNGEDVWFKFTKNIMDVENSAYTQGQISFDKNTHIITSLDTNTIRLTASVEVGKTYVVSYKNKVGFERMLVQDFNNGGTWLTYGESRDKDGYVVFTANSDIVMVSFTTTAVGNTVEKVQLETGAVPTSYEPYIENEVFVKGAEGEYSRALNLNIQKLLYCGLLYSGQPITLKNVKRFLDIYFTMDNTAGASIGKFTIDTTVARLTFGSVVTTCHDTTDMLEFYVCECSFDNDTNALELKRTGFINIKNGTFTERYSGSYRVYQIYTHD